MAMTESRAGATCAPTPPAPSRAATAAPADPATSGSARAPCDAFLVLAQAPAGLVCFLLERGAGNGVPAPQGQARHPLAAVLGGRVPRRRGTPARRRGTRGADDHRDGHAHPAGLRVGSRPAMRRGVAEAVWHAPPEGVRAPAGRAAADGQGARRPRDRVRGGHRDRAAARARLRRGRHGAAAVRHRGRSSTGSASARRRTPSRRWSASAATATSRSRRCRGCCATRR